MHTQADGGALAGVEPIVELLGIRVQFRLGYVTGLLSLRYRLPQGAHTRFVPLLLLRQQGLEDRQHYVDLVIQILEELVLANYMLRI